MPVVLHHGDCLDIMRTLPDCSVDSIVTDPPYGLGFMGKAWDDLPPGEEWARECLRVLKPGGHLLAFGGTRTWHRLACAVEDAGFEVRDSIAWLYGSGFPKSLDVSKAIDKRRDDRADAHHVTSHLADLADAAGITRADVDQHMQTSDMGGWWLSRLPHRSACPSVENWTRLRDFIPGAYVLDAEVWRLNGRKGSPGEAWDQREVLGIRKGAQSETTGRYGSWGNDDGSGRSEFADTAPATPDAERWQGWGTALKPAFEPVVVARKPLAGTVAQNVLTHGTGALNVDGCRIGTEERTNAPAGNKPGGASYNMSVVGMPTDAAPRTTAGRWPANVVLDESQADALDERSGTRPGMSTQRDLTTTASAYFGADKHPGVREGYNDTGGASRFFYVAKAPKRERPRTDDGTAHPTVKPLALMRWLVRLVTPPGGVVLEPFAGSGTTVEACILEGFDCIAIEREADYLPLIETRIERATA